MAFSQSNATVLVVTTVKVVGEDVAGEITAAVEVDVDEDAAVEETR